MAKGQRKAVLHAVHRNVTAVVWKYIYGKLLRQEWSVVNCPFSFGQGDMLNTGAELHFLSGEMSSLKLFK